MSVASSAQSQAREFCVLVADDEPAIRRSARLQLARIPHVNLIECVGPSDSIAAIESQFFHLAFIDLSFSTTSREIHDGRRVLDALWEHSPSCAVIVVSSVIGINLDPFLVLLSPDRIRTLGGIVTKSSDEIPYGDITQRFVDRFNARTVTSPDIGAVVTALSKRRNTIVRRDADSQEREVLALLCDLFGDLRVSLLGTPDDVVRVDLKGVKKGLSASVVFEAEPVLGHTSNGAEIVGNRCVVKIGPRDAIAQEVAAYRQVVRYGVSLSRRTELLGSALRDDLGAICYSYAGGRGVGIVGLDEIFAQQDTDRTCEVIRHLFSTSPENRRWYAVSGEERTLHSYFNQRTASASRDATGILRGGLKNLGTWAQSLRLPNVHLELDEARVCLKFEGFDLELPGKAFAGDNGFQAHIPTCLTHGDLHGGNVLVDRENQPWLIDFASAGIGPRAIDLASLMASLRIEDADRELTALGPSPSDSDKAHLFQSLAKSNYEERRLWKAYLGGVEKMDRPPGTGQPFWSEASSAIVQAWQENFESVHPLEVLYTCLAQAIWIVGFGQAPVRMMRLASWIDGLLAATRAAKHQDPDWPV